LRYRILGTLSVVIDEQPVVLGAILAEQRFAMAERLADR
jgi:hypothetical protein